jgi:hypothetical protein
MPEDESNSNMTPAQNRYIAFHLMVITIGTLNVGACNERSGAWIYEFRVKPFFVY